MKDSKPIIELCQVSRFYVENQHKLVILDEINFSLYPGEMVALVAPSGTGKSSLLHIAGLLERPNQGDIYVFGTPCASLSDSQRTFVRRDLIGFVYQSPHLLAEFTAIENIMLPQMLAGVNKKLARERALELLSYMQLEGRGEHRPNQLSGGEQQRVAIARAVANVPMVLLADEPTGNLDPATSEHVFNLLRRLLKHTGLSALIATHNYELARKMDRVVTLKNKKLESIELGSTNL